MGGAPTKAQSPEGVDKLLRAAESILQQSAPARKELLGQTLEALKTGGVGARIPIIQRAVEASKQATGNAMRETSGQLASRGITGPYASSILSATREAGGQAASQIPTNIAGEMVGAAPGVIGGFTSQALGGLSSAGSMDLQRQEFNVTMFSKFMEDLKQSLQSLGSMGIGGGPGGSNTNPQIESGAQQYDQFGAGGYFSNTDFMPSL